MGETQSTPELLPCPFCGGEGEMRSWDWPYERWQVRCAKCKAHARARMAQEAEAIAAWNTRSTPDRNAVLPDQALLRSVDYFYGRASERLEMLVEAFAFARSAVLEEAACYAESEAAMSGFRSETCSEDMAAEFCFQADFAASLAAGIRALTTTPEPTDPAGPSIEAVMRFAVIDGTEHKYDITNPAGVSEMEGEALVEAFAREMCKRQGSFEPDEVREKWSDGSVVLAWQQFADDARESIEILAALRTPPVLEVVKEALAKLRTLLVHSGTIGGSCGQCGATWKGWETEEHREGCLIAALQTMRGKSV